jgi:pimeloyl-ACP methyl ester carboxylesterase
MSEEISPFQIHASDEELADLKRRLAATRWPDEEPVSDWSQGTPRAYLQEVVDYWCNQYDWRAREAYLNSFAQFKTEVNGVGIHFVHVRSPEKNALPLVISHGWPGSIVEFHKVIGPLTDPVAHGGRAEDAFHVVCPSLPGYGFSDKPTTTGWNVSKIADTFSALMLKLGYDRYVAQGGDWGAMITTCIGAQDPEHCLGIHLNMPIAPPTPESMDNLTEFEQAALASINDYGENGSGYSKQQSTRPQTVGYGLVDSPAGQAGWILEKFYAWTDCDGHPENIFSRDELLDNVMFFWLPGNGASSARLYWESFNNPPFDAVEVKVGASIYPKEIFRSSERWVRARFPNVVHFNTLEKGGHFAALEQPETFVSEIRACMQHMR